jgi:integrase
LRVLKEGAAVSLATSQAPRPIADERFYKWLLNRRRVKRTTADDYMRHLRYIGEHFGQHPLELDADDIETYLEQPMSWSRRNLTLVALRHQTRWAKRRGLPHDDQIEELHPGRRDQAVTQPLSLDEAQRVIVSARTLIQRRVVLLGLYAGLRRFEIIDVGRDDFVTGLHGWPMLRVLGKGDQLRNIPVHDAIASNKQAILEGWAPKRTMQNAIARLRQQTGISHLTIRCFRRTFSETLHERHDIERPVIGGLLGHSTSGITETHYVPPRPGELIHAMQVLDYGLDPSITWGLGIRQMRLFEHGSW